LTLHLTTLVEQHSKKLEQSSVVNTYGKAIPETTRYSTI